MTNEIKIFAVLLLAAFGVGSIAPIARAEPVLIRARVKFVDIMPDTSDSDPDPASDMQKDNHFKVVVVEPLIGHAKKQRFDAIIRLHALFVDMEQKDVLLFTDHTIRNPKDKYERFLLWSSAEQGFCINAEDAEYMGIADQVQRVQRDHGLECKDQ